MAQKGNALTLKIGANAVGAERGVNLSLSRNLIDVTTKSSGEDKEYLYGTLTAQSTFNSLYVFNDTAQDALESAVQAGTSLTVDITTAVSGEKHFAFSAYITSLELGSPTDDAATASGTLQATGAITYADV